ncbi:hypothetical protein [Nitratireductor luteus]|uniref:hypothetical protein n=1 Tax=Nitratireductor luteus TaxID=2976980 RepID=UPI00223F89F8|nr:hypothetical protein [Nitratireductor luteus]
MWEFIKDNHGAISAVTAVLTMMIWVLYFQLLLNSYRHRIRPKININRGGGRSSNSRCVITNMSAEAVYVDAVILTFKGGEKQRICSLSDLDVSPSADKDLRQQLLQGPLASGEFIDIGSFDELIEHAGEGDTIASDTKSIEVMVVGTYTADDGLIAAERRYELSRRDGQRLLQPVAFSTRQVRSRWERRKIEQLMLEWYGNEASAHFPLPQRKQI